MKKLYLPLKLTFGYILITVAVNFFGPWNYRDYNKLVVTVFMTVFMVVCVIGYQIGTRAKIVPVSHKVSRRFLLRAYSFSLFVTLILYFLQFYSSILDHGFVSIAEAISNIGSTYFSSIRAPIEERTDLVVQLLTLFSFLGQFAIIGGMFWYKELRIIQKVMFLSLLSIYLLNAIMFSGTQKPIGDIIIYFISVIVIKERFTNKPKLGRILVATAILSLLIFGYMQLSRLSFKNSSVLALVTHPYLQMDLAHPLFTILGLQLGGVLALISLYFSMGYYGLSLSLQQGFVWTHGLGNSFALSSYATQYLDILPTFLNTYPARVQQATSWPALAYWQTVFPWLASDFTFLGTIFLFGMLAYIYARTWREATEYANILSVLLFANLNIMWLFVPANNQLMQTRGSTLTVIILAICWILFHKKLNTQHQIVKNEVGDESPTLGVSNKRVGRRRHQNISTDF